MKKISFICALALGLAACSSNSSGGGGDKANDKANNSKQVEASAAESKCALYVNQKLFLCVNYDKKTWTEEKIKEDCNALFLPVDPQITQDKKIVSSCATENRLVTCQVEKYNTTAYLYEADVTKEALINFCKENDGKPL
ncbi:MAG: hypothetical protein ACOYOK_03960 [Pseudobdellovibrionaceae bacterium]